MGTQGKQMTLAEANRRAKAITNSIKTEWSNIETHIAGSVRREKEFVNDIDFILITADGFIPKYLNECFPMMKFTSLGNKKGTALSQDGIQFDFNACTPEEFGSFQLHCTGSKQHNIILRSKACKLGCSLSQYGLKLLTGELIRDTEQNIFKALGMSYVEPKDR